MNARILGLTLAALVLGAPAASAAPPAAPPDEHEVFLSTLGRYTDLSYEGLAKRWGLAEPERDGALSFDPAKAKYYDAVVQRLNLQDADKRLLAREGFVLAQPAWGRSVAATLRDIFTDDLPLLVTTDAILDAVHRSYDAILADLESDVLSPLLRATLERAHAKVLGLAKTQPALLEAAGDLDLYLTIARNLLTPDVDDEGRGPMWGDEVPTALTVAPTLADRAEVERMLAAVDGGHLENGDDEGTVFYGAKRRMDWTQFIARGHYTDSAALVRYFRAMMWLGRADLGFQLDKPRQLRAAGLLALALEQSGADDALGQITAVIDLFAGGSGDLDLPKLLSVMRAEGIKGAADLADATKLAAVAASLDAQGLGRPRIRSQVVKSEATDPAHAMASPYVQVFGQRFAIDSFVLSHVVYDDIVYQGQKMLRRLPTGLDVAAVVFGSEIATRLLQPEIEAWHYAANLAALRDTIVDRPDALWQGSLYDLWLAGLRTLSAPPEGKHVPEVMRRPSWKKKMLATQLASWAHLRHDNILYTQESYSAGGGCIYPMAFVEPYPAFYEAFGRFAQVAAQRLGALPVGRDRAARAHLKRLVKYYQRFEKVMGQLARLAQKELDGRPFTKAEQRFLRRTVQQHDSGDDEYMPTITWDGWYMDLLYRDGADDAKPLELRPTIADVHTDAHTASVLEAGTGHVDVVVVAIDNAGDRAIYVGPALTYHEFAQPATERLDDVAWTQEVYGYDDAKPVRGYPSWLAPYRTKLTEREDVE
ncbi:MAG: DUF3160 domain-containing protein [Deltaproteobacteria bacterium]|nr:MAG: DUF3160 domain-containing protein [Deltaproteobacteria bacterium]